MTFKPNSIDWLLISGWGYPADSLGLLKRELADRWDEAGQVIALSGEAYLAEGALAKWIDDRSRDVILVGWSLGGLLSLQAASDCERVRGLVLVSSTPKFCSADGFDSGVPAAQLRAMSIGLRRDPKGTLLDFYQRCAQPGRVSNEQLELLLDTRMADSELPPLAEGLKYLARADLLERLPSVSVPSLVIHGEADRIIQIAAGRDLATHLQRSRLVMMPSSGHDLTVRRHDAVADEICQFRADIFDQTDS